MTKRPGTAKESVYTNVNLGTVPRLRLPRLPAKLSLADRNYKSKNSRSVAKQRTLPMCESQIVRTRTDLECKANPTPSILSSVSQQQPTTLTSIEKNLMSIFFSFRGVNLNLEADSRRRKKKREKIRQIISRLLFLEACISSQVYRLRGYV